MKECNGAVRKIMETRNYRMFELSEFNRDVKKTQLLEASLVEYGWLDAFPMFTFHNGRKLEIKDGHRRFEVAQKLGIPVKYVIASLEQAAIPILNIQTTTKPWDPLDFLASNVRIGNPDYIRVKEYWEETGISLSQCISLLGGDSAGSGNHNRPFKKGCFKLGDQTHASAVADVVLAMKRAGIVFATNTMLVLAVSKILRVDEIDIGKLKARIAAYSYLFERARTVDDYIEKLEGVYNRQSPKKLPVKFLAIEKAKERNAVNASIAAKEAAVDRY